MSWPASGRILCGSRCRLKVVTCDRVMDAGLRELPLGKKKKKKKMGLKQQEMQHFSFGCWTFESRRWDCLYRVWPGRCRKPPHAMQNCSVWRLAVRSGEVILCSQEVIKLLAMYSSIQTNMQFIVGNDKASTFDPDRSLQYLCSVLTFVMKGEKTGKKKQQKKENCFSIQFPF